MSEIEKKWYVLRAVSGKESKVKEYLDADIKNSDLSEYVSQVLIPTEKVYQVRNGKKIVKERSYLPGYVLVEAALVGEVAHHLRNTPNVIGFLGGSENPVPLRQSEVNRILGTVDELQDAVRQGKSTVLEWRWVPVDKLHRDVQSSWMPVLVQVTPSESTTGMTARLSVTYGDTTELHDMGVLAGDIYQAQLVFTVGQTYDLTIQWTAADGAVANEKLGTVDFTATQTEPELAWGRIGNTLDYGYYINRSGNKKYLELSCYPVEVELTVPNWMKIADVTLELRTGEEGEPLATAQLAADGWYSSGEETMMHAVWNGTFYKDDGPNKWLYADGQPFYRAIVTDATSTTWTFEVPLQKK